MTLIKSILLGSAAGIVAVASAQAADLPTRKAAPVQYVAICNVGGITGWVLPGSDTCVKLSGYITGQVLGGTLNTEYNFGNVGDLVGTTNAYTGGHPAAGIAGLLPGGAKSTSPLNPFTGPSGIGGSPSQRVLIAASPAQGNQIWNRNETGWDVRFNAGFDFASNTAYGPLIGHGEIQGDLGNGLEPLIGNGTNDYYINQAYLTWAGITAGKAASFFSFIGGGDNWANFASPDQKGFNEPIQMAYTASFGGGFSATIAAQSQGSNGFSGYGSNTSTGSIFDSNTGAFTATPNLTYGGMRWPDIVGNLHVKQAWGEAQISGVLHNVNVEDAYYGPGGVAGLTGAGCGLGGGLACNGRENKTGWGLDAGVRINLPSLGPGDDFVLTGAYTQSAVWFSGLGDMMWGEFGQVNGNGQPIYAADGYFNPATNQWSSPTVWSVSGLLEHHWTPQFYTDIEGSILGYNWSNMGGGCYILGAGCGLAQAVQGPLSPHSFAWLVGADLGWNPVTNLNFDLELMYMNVNQSTPSGFLGTVYGFGGPAPTFVPGDWRGNSNGFEGKLRITRYF